MLSHSWVLVHSHLGTQFYLPSSRGNVFTISTVLDDTQFIDAGILIAAWGLLSKLHWPEWVDLGTRAWWDLVKKSMAVHLVDEFKFLHAFVQTFIFVYFWNTCCNSHTTPALGWQTQLWPTHPSLVNFLSTSGGLAHVHSKHCKLYCSVHCRVYNTWCFYCCSFVKKKICQCQLIPCQNSVMLKGIFIELFHNIWRTSAIFADEMHPHALIEFGWTFKDLEVFLFVLHWISCNTFPLFVSLISHHLQSHVNWLMNSIICFSGK